MVTGDKKENLEIKCGEVTSLRSNIPPSLSFLFFIWKKTRCWWLEPILKQKPGSQRHPCSHHTHNCGESCQLYTDEMWSLRSHTLCFSFARLLAWTSVDLIDLFFVAPAGKHREAASAEFLSHGHMCQQGPEEVLFRGFLACRLELRCSWLQISSVLKPRGLRPWNFSPLPPSSWWRFMQWVLAGSPPPRALSLTTHRKLNVPLTS